MSQLIVRPSVLAGEVEAPSSKSYTHRLLSVALLADGESKIRKPLLSSDTHATINAVENLGGQVSNSEDSLVVSGTGGEIRPRKEEINVQNSGTTLRLMSAISALSPERVLLTGDESILKRPMGPLIDSLVDLGADAEARGRNGRPPVAVGGGLEGGETTITGEISSQFISALLIATPYSEVGADIEVEEGLKSKPYVLMTLRTLELADADIGFIQSLTNYNIPGNQIFKPFDFTVPGDFSSAAFLLGAAALAGEEVKVKNLDLKDVQGDKKIVEYLKDFGAELKVKHGEIVVYGGQRLHGIDADCMNTPDLVPILAVLGSLAEGQTRLYNVSHLRYKEVDRLKVLTTELQKFGAEIEASEDELVIDGNESLRGGTLNSYGDHRMAMAFAVAGLSAEKPVKVKGAESIGISYPGFVKDMQCLGAEMSLEK